MKVINNKIIAPICILLLAICLSKVSVKAENNTAVNMKAGTKFFKCVFYNNDSARALLKKMPIKYKMQDLNGNEKYKYLKNDLPANEKRVKKIKAGDIMLYGTDCLVIFYKSFTTSYKYTPVGRITNPKGLKKALGNGKVTIQFSRKKTIGFTHKNLVMTPGETETIKLRGATAKKVRWSSSNKKAATVSKGKIKARKAGKTTITARYKNKKYKCKVIIRAEQRKTKQPAADTEEKSTDNTEKVSAEASQPKEERKLTMVIGDKRVNVQWEENESVEALKKLCEKEPLTIQMSMYGGFEQVGPIGSSLPKNDVQTTTSSGDIVLYSGNQMVVFYGSNSWAYTRLGHITDQDEEGMKELLGKGNITITINMEEIG